MNLSKINFEFDYNLSKKKYFAGSASIKENIITLQLDLLSTCIWHRYLLKSCSGQIMKKKMYQKLL